jgi:hypothetical protein
MRALAKTILATKGRLILSPADGIFYWVYRGDKNQNRTAAGHCRHQHAELVGHLARRQKIFPDDMVRTPRRWLHRGVA